MALLTWLLRAISRRPRTSDQPSRESHERLPALSRHLPSGDVDETERVNFQYGGVVTEFRDCK